MRIQVIDEQGVLWSDHPVGIHIDPDHGFCDLCERPTPVLFDVTIYPSDDFPILRCHGCVGDGSPGERLVGVATAGVADSHDIYIIDPHGYIRLPHDQAHTLGQELADHLAHNPPKRPLTARERDILTRILRDVITAASSPTPIATPVYPNELPLLAQMREVLDPRTD